MTASAAWLRPGRRCGGVGFARGAVASSRPSRPSRPSAAAAARRPSSTAAAAAAVPAAVPARWPGSLVTLGIETSCDDTCVAVLETVRSAGKDDAGRARGGVRARLLFEERVTADNRAFGGIHPLTAAEAHMEALGPLVQRALARMSGGGGGGGSGGAGGSSTRTGWAPDLVAATRGPGMVSSLATGLAVAKGLAAAWRVPLVGVHHMQAHALTPRLVAALEASGAAGSTPGPPSPPFPYLSLLVSGGHTLLVRSRALADHRVLAAAANIAVGDLLDKSARALLPPGAIAAAEAAAGRSLPYGALLEQYAFGGAASAYSDYAYPRARRDEMAPFVSPRGGWQLEAPLGKNALRKALRFDFSGLNGAVHRVVEEHAAVLGDDHGGGDSERRLLARAVMQLAFEHLASRLLLALETSGEENDEPPPTSLVVSGGVASNGFLRHVLRSALDGRGHGDLPLVAPPPALCTDNAAMIAWAGAEMYEAGWQTDLAVRPVRKWSMDAAAADGGILGMGGWLRRT